MITIHITNVMIEYIKVAVECINSPPLLLLKYCMLMLSALFIKCNKIGKTMFLVRRYTMLNIKPKHNG